MGSSAAYAIAAPDRPAADAAAQCFEAGGSAVDAALAAALVTCVVELGIASPMGGCFITVWPHGGDPVTVDGNSAMPGRGASVPPGSGMRDVTLGYGGGITVIAGHGSVAVPGLWAAYELAHQRWGRLPWKDVLAPAIEVARGGHHVGRSSAHYLTFSGDPLYGWHPESRAYLRAGTGEIPGENEVVHSPQLAATLEHLAQMGARDVYTGDVAAAIVKEVQAGEGLLTAEDLAAYQAEFREPLRQTIGEWDAAVNPGPGVGGPTLAAMLTLSERIYTEHPHLSDTEWASATLRVQHAVLRYRATHLDRADDVAVAGRRLVELARGPGLEAIEAACEEGVIPVSSPNTAHVSMVDAEGTGCALTTSAGYGSGVMVPRTGLYLNNALGEPELNQRSLDSLPPGTRFSSNMAPTVGRSAQGTVLAIGSPGADRITTAIHSTLTELSMREGTLYDAVVAPRGHVSVRAGGPVVEFEDVPHLREAATATGWQLKPHSPMDMYFGGVAAALRRHDGAMEATSDPRRDGAALVRQGGAGAVGGPAPRLARGRAGLTP